MITAQQLDRALAYFTDEDHQCSYELLEGAGHVMFSAPHAMLQTRNGSVKCAERFTGMLCRILHERQHCPVIYKTRHLCDDANHDPVSDYRDALCRYIQQHHVRYLIDLHQMKPERAVEACIGTGRGRNLQGCKGLVEKTTECLRAQGVRHITVDQPFDASGPNTVCATVAARCHIPALQLELSTRLLMSGYDEYRFDRILDALGELAERINRSEESVAL